MKYVSEIHEKNIDSQSLSLEGWWGFDEVIDNTIADLSGKCHILKPNGNLKWINEPEFTGAVVLNGATQWLSTDRPVLCTDKSFSITAWVCLDSVAMNSKLVLKTGVCALTAVSQDSPTHSAFHLGIRLIKEMHADGNIIARPKWCFTVSPIDEKGIGEIECQFAHSPSPLDDSVLDKWVMLVGTCDVVNKTTHIYVPSVNETGKVSIPSGWTFLQANEGLQIGRGRWLGRDVDHWPGCIGPVRAFSGVLTEEDAKKIYIKDSMKMKTSIIFQG